MNIANRSQIAITLGRNRVHLLRVVAMVLFVTAFRSSSVFPNTFAAEAQAGPSFTKDIAPLLARKCMGCHSEKKAKGGYRLENYDSLLKPGDGGEMPIARGKPGQSELYRRITADREEDRMPQKDDPLSLQEKALIERWILEGASFDGSDPKTRIADSDAKTRTAPAAYSHAWPVLALAFRPGTNELAVAGYREVTLWDPVAGRMLRRLQNLPERIQSLAFSRDGKTLAVAGGDPGRRGEVALIDAESGSVEKVLGEMPDMMLSVRWHPDGKSLAAGGADNAIHLYDSVTGKERAVIQQHADWVLSIDFSPDGGRLVSASRDRTSRTFRTDNNELDTSYTEHSGAVNTVAFTADGKTVLSAGRDKRIHLWNADDGKKLGEIGGFEGEITRLIVAGDQVFSSCTDRLVRQHNLGNRRLVRSYKGSKDWIYALAYDPGSKRIVSGGYDGEVRIWKTTDGSFESEFMASPGVKTVAR